MLAVYWEPAPLSRQVRLSAPLLFMKSFLPLLSVLSPVLLVCTYLLNIILAVITYKLAARRKAEGSGPYAFGPWLWCFVVFIFSLLGFAFYWLANDSTLAPCTKKSAGEQVKAG